MQFKGIYTPAVTPYKQDFTIDKKAYAEVLESLIDAKVHGIIVAGSTGEYYAQTQQERLELAEYAKEVIVWQTTTHYRYRGNSYRRFGDLCKTCKGNRC